VKRLDPKAPSAHARRAAGRWRVDLAPIGFLPASIAEGVARFRARTSVPFVQAREERRRTIDLAPLVSELEARDRALTFLLVADGRATAKPDEIVSAVLGVEIPVARQARFVLERAIERDQISLAPAAASVVEAAPPAEPAPAAPGPRTGRDIRDVYQELRSDS
jgi:hypothetical protein